MPSSVFCLLDICPSYPDDISPSPVCFPSASDRGRFNSWLIPTSGELGNSRDRPVHKSPQGFKVSSYGPCSAGCAVLWKLPQTLCTSCKMPSKIISQLFGQTKDKKDVTRYTLSNSKKSLEVSVIDYGGSITEIKVPDRQGKIVDVELAFDDVAGYESERTFLGALMGRAAGRIAGGQFTLDGKTYNLFINDAPNSHHGGQFGFDTKLWSGKIDGDKLIMQYVSPDGEESYPGELTAKVTFQVTEESELRLDYEATTTKATPVNLTSHPFFNLAGHDAGSLDDHLVTIFADSYTVTDENNVCTGEIASVEGTYLDLRKPVKVVDKIGTIPTGKGYDHNLCLTASDDGQPKLAAKVEHPPSGIFMECYTTEPGMQFYTSYYLNVTGAKGGANYKRFGALCLEAQHYPNSPNLPSFPNVILRPGETYRQTTIYKFGIA